MARRTEGRRLALSSKSPPSAVCLFGSLVVDLRPCSGEQSLTCHAESRVRLQVSPCKICVGQSGTEAGFSPSNSVFPCQYPYTIGALTSSACLLTYLLTYLIHGAESSLRS